MARPLRLLTIIGARPQIIKASALSRAVAGPFAGRLEEIILHTGQHYDASMSQVFFDELEIPRPHIQLDAGSASHGVQTARMLEGIEAALVKERPDVVVIYGDTNSTLAGAIAASKLHIPVAHIEAGLRSFNKAMPEEINRIVSDHCSTWLFCPTATAVQNLAHEGLIRNTDRPVSLDHPRVMLSGDVMYDNSLHFAALAEARSTLLADLSINSNAYVLATIHRPANTDDPKRLNAILEALMEVSSKHDLPLVLPLHPRTRAKLDASDDPVYRALFNDKRFHVIPPVGFLDMTALENHSRLVCTDSGGVQKEAFFFGKPGVILRAETEWVEIVEHEMAILADADPERIIAAADHFLHQKPAFTGRMFGDGRAAEHICAELLATAPA